MKKRVVLVLLLLAVVAVMAFAATRVSFSTGQLGTGVYGQGTAITVNWVEKSTTLGKTTIYINYTVNENIESMLLCCKVTSPTPKFGAWNRHDNSERLISKGKTYTANMGTTSLDVNAVEVWLENVNYKK
jgi:hypothetical protein